MKYDLSILFYLKKSKEDKVGLIPIYLRITINGVRTEISTNRKIELFKWDSKSQRAKGRSDEARNLNNHIDNLENQVKRDYNSLIEKNTVITADILSDLLGGENRTKYFLIKIFETNNKLIKKEEGYKYSKRTIGQYKTVLERLKLFLSEDYTSNDIELEKLDVFFIRKFDIFLKTKYSIEHNTIMKYLKELKKVIHFAMQLGYLDKDPFLQYKTTYKQFSRESLTQEELYNIETHTFKIKRLDQVKDIFIFVCYTGFSYSDLFLLTPESITKGIDGKNWIIYEREKTGVRASIPILLQAQIIIDKYKADPKCLNDNKLLPVISNQKLNSYLSEIADVCDINKHITMHLGRHTFATTVTLTNGVPIETVSKMLGHTSIKTTQIYSKVVDAKTSKDMEALSIKLLLNTQIIPPAGIQNIK
jgi:site-specific recombinase XerD